MEGKSRHAGKAIRLACATVAILLLGFYLGYEREYQPVVNVTVEPKQLASLLRVQRGMPREELRNLRMDLHGGASFQEFNPNPSTPPEDPAVSNNLGNIGPLEAGNAEIAEDYRLDPKSEEVALVVQRLKFLDIDTAKSYFIKTAMHLAENERCGSREAGLCLRSARENEDEEVLYIVGTCATGQRILSFTPRKQYQGNKPTVQIILTKPEGWKDWKSGCADATKDENEVKEAFRRHGLLDAYTAFVDD